MLPFNERKNKMYSLPSHKHTHTHTQHRYTVVYLWYRFWLCLQVIGSSDMTDGGKMLCLYKAKWIFTHTNRKKTRPRIGNTDKREGWDWELKKKKVHEGCCKSVGWGRPTLVSGHLRHSRLNRLLGIMRQAWWKAARMWERKVLSFKQASNTGCATDPCLG